MFHENFQKMLLKNMQFCISVVIVLFFYINLLFNLDEINNEKLLTLYCVCKNEKDLKEIDRQRRKGSVNGKRRKIKYLLTTRQSHRKLNIDRYRLKKVIHFK